MLKTRVSQLAALLILAALFGGGGVAYGLANLVVQLAALLVLALNFAAVRDFALSGPRLLVALVATSLALPLLQLLPLPPSVWTAMPGRELVSEAFASARVGESWFATSLNPSRTLVAFIGLIAPFAVIAIGWRLGGDPRLRVMQVVVALGLLNVALGVVQVLGGGGVGVLYAENEMPGVLFGFFANRNSTGLFLVCCLILLAALPSVKSRTLGGLTLLLAAVLLALGVILTQSRTSIVLLALPLALAAFRAVSTRAGRSEAGSVATSRTLLVAGIAVAILASLLPMIDDTRVGTALGRFERVDDQRALIWDDASYTAKRYWPLGSGMATFDEVFQADESLEHISPRKAGRAHNDYLELAIEAGAIGLALAAVWALWIALSAWRAISTQQRWPALAGTGIMLAIALQSALDYPLRNQTMLCLAAIAIVLIAPPGRRTTATTEQEPVA